MTTGGRKPAAVIDVGTNTVLLLVAQINPDHTLSECHQELRIPRLGQGLAASGCLNPANANKALAAITELIAIARSYHAGWIKIVATAALREAGDGLEFAKRVHRITGIPVTIISGQEEARYAYMGALSNKPHLQGRNLVIDIGGGSTELTWGEGDQYGAGLSLSMGSVKLTEAYALSGPADPARCDRASRSFLKLLAAQDHLPSDFDSVIGTAGTWTTLAAVNAEMTDYDAAIIDGSILWDNEIRAMVDRFSSLEPADRLAIPGLSAGREDVILGGGLIALALVQWAQTHQVTISDRGLRAGVIMAGVEG